MLTRRYQAIFRSRYHALFWAGTILVSAYFAVRPAAEEAPVERVVPVSKLAPEEDKSLEQLIAEAEAKEAARQDALKEVTR